MYQVGEYIVHPGQGVCKVDEISGEAQETYMLLPVGVRHPIRISYPVASEGRLRPVLSKDEAEALIDEYPQMDTDDFTERSVALEHTALYRQIAVAEKLKRNVIVADLQNGLTSAVLLAVNGYFQLVFFGSAGAERRGQNDGSS